MTKNRITPEHLDKSIAQPGVVEQSLGIKFGRLTVISYKGSLLRQGCAVPYVQCKCDCGNEHFGCLAHIRNGRSRSCGCLKSETVRKRLTKHGFAPLRGKRKPVYKSWQGMKSRCRDVKNSHYKYYGGRGIRVCQRWLGPDGFKNFLADLGEPEAGMSIERIDVNGDYEPSNCCWIPLRDQSKNRNHNWKVSVGGSVTTARGASRIAGLGRSLIDERLRRCGSDKAAIHDIEAILQA